jgi:hypothetical protein
MALVVPPRHTVHPRSRLPLQPEERLPQRFDVHVVKQRREPLLLPLPYCLPYTVKSLEHGSPALSPVRVRSDHVPHSPPPWLHRLRFRRSGFVRRLRRYCAGVRLLLPVHHRLRLLAFPMRSHGTTARGMDSRSPGSRAGSVHAYQGLRPRRAGWDTRDSAPRRVAFRIENRVGTQG